MDIIFLWWFSLNLLNSVHLFFVPLTFQNPEFFVFWKQKKTKRMPANSVRNSIFFCFVCFENCHRTIDFSFFTFCQCTKKMLLLLVKITLHDYQPNNWQFFFVLNFSIQNVLNWIWKKHSLKTFNSIHLFIFLFWPLNLFDLFLFCDLNLKF